MRTPGILLLSLTACGNPPIPAPESPVRALTPTEYNNTVRDLFGMPMDADQWPLLEEGDFADEEEEEFEREPWPWPFPAESGVEDFEGIAEGQVPSAYLIEQLQLSADFYAQYAHMSPVFFTCREWDDMTVNGQKKCGWDSVSKFAHRAYRRPLTESELSRLESFWEANWASGTPAEAIVLTVSGVLQTPQFLYRIEHGIPDKTKGPAVPLDAWETASRLSYFLWDSMPDPELFEAASKNNLKTDKQIAAQARRMLEDPRAREAVVRFHDQWLGIDDIYAVNAASKQYADLYGVAVPGEDDAQDAEEVWSIRLIAMRKSMEFETRLFVERTVFDGAGTFEALLTDNHGYVSDYTLPLYGSDTKVLSGPQLSWTSDDGNVGYDMTLSIAEFPKNQRAGLITMPSVLALRSHPVHPAPVLRGKFILERMACMDMGQPPEGAEGQAPPDTPDASATNRERLQTVTANAPCSNCHDTINPAGFAFENYDSLGGFRTEDNGRPVDATGKITLGDGETIAFTGGVDFANKLAKSDAVRACYALHWTRYATGFYLHDSDSGVAELQQAFQKDDDVRELLVSIASSDLFRYRALPGGEK